MDGNSSTDSQARPPRADSDRQRAIRRRLASYARPLSGLVALGTLALVLRSAVEPLMMLLLHDLLQVLGQPGGSLDSLSSKVGLMVGAGVLLAVSDFGHMFLFDYVALHIIRRVRGDLFARIQRLSLGYFEDARTGELLSRATNDISVLQSRLNFEVARLIKCPLTIVGLLGYMLWASWPLTLVSFGMVLVLIPLVSVASNLMRRHARTVQDSLADLSARMEESLAAIRVVQCFGATELEIERFERENAAVRRAVMRTVRVRSLLEPVVHLVGLLGLLVVMWVGGYYALVLQRLDPARLLTMLGSLQMITTNFKMLGRARLALAEVTAAADKVFAVIDTESDVTDRDGALELTDVQGRVTFRSVGFRYRSGRQVLQGIDLELEPGQAVAVVGPSGAGKSTLANLIPRLYDATEGAVLVDGHDVRDVSLASLRRHIGIVPQETVLFRGTLRENIAYGKPDATLEDVVAAAQAANADEFIRQLPHGYETQAGERGKKLSGGQAQRIAIARAILRNPRILILDEATSSLDSANEALVQEALERLMRDRTTLIIAHRLSTIQSADRIVVLSEGRIMQSGSHQELLAQDGHYRNAYLLQLGSHAA